MFFKRKSLAYNNDQSTKRKYVCRLRALNEMDTIRLGEKWENGKGHSLSKVLDNEATAEIEIGFPAWFQVLYGQTFEGMSNQEAFHFTERVMSLLPVGFDINSLKDKVFCMLCERILTKINREKHPEMATAVQALISYYSGNKKVDLKSLADFGVGLATKGSQDSQWFVFIGWFIQAAAAHNLLWMLKWNGRMSAVNEFPAEYDKVANAVCDIIRAAITE